MILATMHSCFALLNPLGMVLLELITRKKIGENGFARRTPAKLFALEAEEVRQESPPDAPTSLLELAAMYVSTSIGIQICHACVRCSANSRQLGLLFV